MCRPIWKKNGNAWDTWDQNMLLEFMYLTM